MDVLLHDAMQHFRVEPMSSDQLVLNGYESCADGVEVLLRGRLWSEIASSKYFLAAKGADLDLADIFIAISDYGFSYYLPGFLVHFLSADTKAYESASPQFYFKFVERLQPERLLRQRVMTKVQSEFTLKCLEQLLIKYGDDYREYFSLGRAEE